MDASKKRQIDLVRKKLMRAKERGREAKVKIFEEKLKSLIGDDAENDEYFIQKENDKLAEEGKQAKIAEEKEQEERLIKLEEEKEEIINDEIVEEEKNKKDKGSIPINEEIVDELIEEYNEIQEKKEKVVIKEKLRQKAKLIIERRKGDK